MVGWPTEAGPDASPSLRPRFRRPYPGGGSSSSREQTLVFGEPDPVRPSDGSEPSISQDFCCPRADARSVRLRTDA